jgi:hypothetical protein
LVQFLWVVMALGLLVALSLAATGNMAPALASVLVAAAAAVAALVANLVQPQPAATASLSGPYGSGPHAKHDCTPDAQRVEALAQMAQQLREAAKDEHWTLDWSRFNEFGEQARAAQAAGDFTRAIRQHALAISFMLSEIRRQPSRKDHRDSPVLDL